MIDWDFVKECLTAVVAAVLSFFAGIILLLALLTGTFYLLGVGDLHNTWGDSAEFSSLMTGQERFSEHETNISGVTVVVDHQTGNQYLCTPDGVTGLMDADGTPLRVMEASDDGED